MINFMLWAAVIVGCIIGLFINPAAIIMLAAFIALGTGAYLVDKVKK